MFRINHNDAIELEYIVRRLYGCERAGISGLCDADNFESYPMDAALLVVSYIHAHRLQSSETQYDEFLCKYSWIFENPEDSNAADEVQNYIRDLDQIVDSYLPSANNL